MLRDSRVWFSGSRSWSGAFGLGALGLVLRFPGLIWGSRASFGAPGLGLGLPGLIWDSQAWFGAPGHGLGLPGLVWGSRAWFGTPGLGLGLPGLVWASRAWLGTPGLRLGRPGLVWGCRALFGPPGLGLGLQGLVPGPRASRRLSVLAGAPRCLPAASGGRGLGLPGSVWASPGLAASLGAPRWPPVPPGCAWHLPAAMLPGDARRQPRGLCPGPFEAAPAQHAFRET